MLLLFLAKAEILMGFDFPDALLGLGGYEQPKSKHNSVCLFVGFLFVGLVGRGGVVCFKPSLEQCLLPTLNSRLFVFKNIWF